MVDGYSGFTFADRLTSLTTASIISKLQNWFRDFGYPTLIRTDGGPQFRAEFKQYCKSIGATKETSSPYYPQSNGLAESAVKQAKHLLSKHNGNMSAFLDALLIWRNTPKSFGFSPSQLMFGYSQNFGQGLPAGTTYIDRQEAEYKKSAAATSTQRSYDKHSKPLPPLLPNTPVLIRHPTTGKWDSHGHILAMRPDGHSYDLVDSFDDPKIRNRRDLRPLLT